MPVLGKNIFAGNYMFSNKLNYSLTWLHFCTIFTDFGSKYNTFLAQ